jgi:hypothetical protein
MRFYNQQHQFYCGIDLHARTMHVCVLEPAGGIVCDRNLPCHFETLLQALAPFRDDLVFGVECLFGWYWIADRCAEHNIPFVLGHALYIKLIHSARNSPTLPTVPNSRSPTADRTGEPQHRTQARQGRARFGVLRPNLRRGR